MELIAISLARVAAFLELQSLDPRGRTSTSNALQRLGDKYAFQKVPQKFEEFDFQKGVEFLGGRLGEINIDRLTLFRDGLAIDLRSSTDDCLRVLEDLLDSMRSALGATMLPTRRMLLSNIVFRSDANLSCLHPVLKDIAAQIASSVSSDFRQAVLFDTMSVSVGADLSQIKLAPSAFTVERRIETPFSANLYFSAAPVGTQQHIELLEQFERALDSIGESAMPVKQAQ